MEKLRKIQIKNRFISGNTIEQHRIPSYLQPQNPKLKSQIPTHKSQNPTRNPKPATRNNSTPQHNMACTKKYFITDNKIQKTENFTITEFEKGESLYEVIKVINGKSLFIKDHIERLHNSAKIRNKEIWLSDVVIIEKVDKLIEINTVSEGRLKFVFRYYKGENKFVCFFLKNIEPEPEVYKTGVKIVPVNEKRNNPNAKIINYDLRKKVIKLKENENAYEALLINDSGMITEGSKSNIFFVKGNIIYTPKNNCVLPGITRKYVFELGENLKIPVKEEDIMLSDIHKFDAVFITGTSIGILPVFKVGNFQFSVNNEVLKQISENYKKIVGNYSG